MSSTKTKRPKASAEPTNQETNVKARLDEIAKKIRAGANPERFQAELDQLLGTALPDRDSLAEAVWEDDYRNREDA
jgi:hypothetical protein